MSYRYLDMDEYKRRNHFNYCVANALNQIPEFRKRIEGDGIQLVDMVYLKRKR